MAAAKVVLYQEAYDLYDLLKRGGHTSKDTAKRFESKPLEYDKEALSELRKEKLVNNAAGPGKMHVLLYLLKDVPVSSKGPKPRRNRIPDARRQRSDGAALTIEDLRNFADRYEQVLEKLLTERTKQAERRLQDAQKAVGGATPGVELSDALVALEQAIAAHSDVATSVQREVLAELKPAKGSRDYKLWQLLAGTSG